MASGALLEVRDLRVSFPLPGRRIQAVRGVSFDLGKGEILGIVGESGSGKSVTTQAIPGLLPDHARVEGSIRYDGVELTRLGTAPEKRHRRYRPYRGARISMIFQEPGRSCDPLQNLGSMFWETFRQSNKRISREESDRRALALLEETGLSGGRERLFNFPHQFSGGQLQRVGIALALAQDCELLIADEPTTALDVTIQKQIVETLTGLRERRGLAIIFISHNIDLVGDIADSVLVMYGGLILERLPAAALAAGSSAGGLHPYTEALLAASPRFGSHYTRERLSPIPGRVPDPQNPEPGCPFAPRCPRAASACRAALPPLRPAEKPGHETRCL